MKNVEELKELIKASNVLLERLETLIRETSDLQALSEMKSLVVSAGVFMFEVRRKLEEEIEKIEKTNAEVR